MVIEYTELAIIVGVVMGLFKLLEKGIDLLSKQFGKGNKDNKQEAEITRLQGVIESLRAEIVVLRQKIEKIETNDLAHINAKLDINGSEHRDIFVVLGRIEERLK